MLACTLTHLLIGAALGAARVGAPSAPSYDAPPVPAAAATAPGLSRSEADAAKAELVAARRERLRSERRAEVDGRTIAAGGSTMRYASTTFGEKPPAGRSLWISLHGGGGAPTKVNDQQWENQARLYRPAEGIYVAPRAPTDSWNMWHQAPIDALLDRLIENLVALEEVDPDRVYLLGYSAGGDGVFQLAPRMADRWAAASMMAGHPGDARPDALRNIGFAIHTGERDAAFERNAHAERWKTLLAELERSDPAGYRHQVQVHAGKGHWMDRDDAVALPWMAGFVRNPRPARMVWVQDDVTHRRFAWLAVDEPKAGARIVVERAGQRVQVVEAPPSTMLRIRLDDEMLDLDAEVVVLQGERELFRGVVPRSRAVLERTLEERGDPRSVFSAEVVVTTAP